MQTADLTRDEAYGLLGALIADPSWDGPTKASKALVAYIVERDDIRGPGWAFAGLDLEPIDFPCRLAFVSGTCPHGHDWRPLTRDGLTFIPFGLLED